MKVLRVFGKTIKFEERKSNRDSVEFANGRIVIASCKRPASSLLKEFLEDLLYSQLCKIYQQIKNEERIDLFGDLDFEILERIDGKKERIAKLKGNKTLVKLSAVTCPESVLEYVIAHEIAHIFTKRHSRRFWRIVGTIYPDFEEGQRLFAEYHKGLIQPIQLS